MLLCWQVQAFWACERLPPTLLILSFCLEPLVCGTMSTPSQYQAVETVALCLYGVMQPGVLTLVS